MENFKDSNILIFCPKCSRLINVILFHFNYLNLYQNLYFDYFCNSCYEYSLKQKKEKDKNSNQKNNEDNNKYTIPLKKKIVIKKITQMRKRSKLIRKIL